MNMLRKIVATGMSVIMLCCASGCSVPLKADQNLKTINIWSSQSHSKNVYNNLIKQYNENEGAKLGVTLVYSVKENNYSETITAAQASNMAPDIYCPIALNQQAENEEIAAIDDMPGGKEFLEGYGNYLTAAYKADIDGKYYTVPNSVTTMGLVYNKEMFKEKGIVDENGNATPPKTYTLMREYARRLTDTSKKQYGIAIPLGWTDCYTYNISRASIIDKGYEIFDPTRGVYDFSGLKPIIEMYLGIKKDKSCFPGSESLENDSARAQFATGKIGMMIAESWDVGVYNDQFPANFDWGVTALPSADENVRYKYMSDPGATFVINSESVKRIGADKIFEVYKWLNSTDTLKRLYQEGAYIPYSPEISDGIDLQQSKKGWKDFAELTNISVEMPKSAGVDISGQRDAKTIFYEDIWTEKVPVDEALSSLTKSYNDGMNKYFSDNPDKNINQFIIENWDTTLK